MSKNKLVMIVLTLIFVGGCGSELANFAGGAVAGGALSGTFAGAEADLERARQQKIAELQTANEDLDNAKGEVEQLAADAKVKSLEKKVQDLTDLQAGVSLAKEGLQVDWKNPAAVGGYSSTLVTAALAWYFRKQQNKESKKRSAEKAGIRKTINELAALPPEAITAPQVNNLLFNNIGSERANQKVA